MERARHGESRTPGRYQARRAASVGHRYIPFGRAIADGSRFVSKFHCRSAFDTRRRAAIVVYGCRDHQDYSDATHTKVEHVNAGDTPEHRFYNHECVFWFTLVGCLLL